MSITRTVCCPTEHHLKIYGSKCVDFAWPALKTACTVRVVGPTGSGYDETAHADGPNYIASLPMPTANGTYTVHADIDPPLDAYYDQGTGTFQFGTYPYVGGVDITFGVGIPPKSDRVCAFDNPIWMTWSMSLPKTLHVTSRYGSSELTFQGTPEYLSGCGGFNYSSSEFNPEADASCGGGTGYARVYAGFDWRYVTGHTDEIIWSMKISLLASTGMIPEIQDTKCGANVVMGSYPFGDIEYLSCGWHSVDLTGTPESDISAEATIEILEGFKCNDLCVTFDGTRTTEVTDTITVTS